jgi:protein-S-isoprenylcysteine O-methyltransferase Ste14
MLVLKIIIGVLFQAFLFGILLLPIAGGYWFEAYFFLCLHVAIAIPYGIYSAVYFPKGMEARMVMNSENQSKKDKIILASIASIMLLGTLLIPTDVFYLEVFEKANPSFQILGLIIYLIGFVVVAKAQNQNDFIEPVVEIQTDRGHKIIDSGLYAYVRHPMYSGFLLFFPGIALWLGSIFSALFLTITLFLLLAYRIQSEEETLQNEFDEYMGYKEKVKAKLIPGIF